MRILVQHTGTKHFLRGMTTWVADGREALIFPDAETAQRFITHHALPAEVVYCGRNNMALPMPVGLSQRKAPITPVADPLTEWQVSRC